jgi:hypothetical protein
MPDQGFEIVGIEKKVIVSRACAIGLLAEP